MTRLHIAGTVTGIALAIAMGCGRQVGGEVPRDDAGRAAVMRFWTSLDEATRLRLGGDYARAAQAYERTLELDPRHEDALYYLGHCQREAGDLDAARGAFTRLVEVNASSARGHLALAAILASPEASGLLDLEAAEAHLRRAHDINREETGPMPASAKC